MKSEFGQGLCYNLGLFLAHADRIIHEKEIYKSIGDEKRAYEIWMYAAADHLYDFRWQEAPLKLQKRCKKFRNKILSLRLPMYNQKVATKDDYKWAIQEAKNLLLAIDEANGVKVIKGSWE